MKKIKVLVSSCACNQKYASLVEAVVKNNQIDATVEKVDDIMEVMQYNVMSLPALVVDDQVVARGQKNEKDYNYHDGCSSFYSHNYRLCWQ